MTDPLTYFITWTTYGTWLPGDVRGWRKTNAGPQLPRLGLWQRACRRGACHALRWLVTVRIDRACGPRWAPEPSRRSSASIKTTHAKQPRPLAGWPGLRLGERPYELACLRGFPSRPFASLLTLSTRLSQRPRTRTPDTASRPALGRPSFPQITSSFRPRHSGRDLKPNGLAGKGPL